MTDRAVVTWAEFEVPGAPGIRRAIITFAEMEVPDAPARAFVGWSEFEVPDPPGVETSKFSSTFSEASEALAGLALVDEHAPTHPYIQAAAQAFKLLAAQGEPITAVFSGTPGAVPRFDSGTKIIDSLISESGLTTTMAGDLVVAGDQTVQGGFLNVVDNGNELTATFSGAGKSPAHLYKTAGVIRGVVGAVANAGELVVGSASGDLVVRSDGGSIRFSADAGSTDVVKFSSTFIDSRVPFRIDGLILIRPRQPGYSPMTGTANRGGSYATSTITLQQLAERVKAFQDDLTGHHGLFGA